MALSLNRTFLRFFVIICVWILVFIFILKTFRNVENNYFEPIIKRRHYNEGGAAEKLHGNDVLPVRMSTRKDDLLDMILASRTLPYKICSNYSSSRAVYNTTAGDNKWQPFESGALKYQLFGTYYDNRPNLPKSLPVVRILAMINDIPYIYPDSYCQLWFREIPVPIVVSVVEHIPIWLRVWGYYTNINLMYTHLLVCQLPDDIKHLIPLHVSLVTEVCTANATNNMPVYYEASKQQQTHQAFAICMKGLNFPNEDISKHLIEWLELMRLLGAEKVYTYVLSVHANTTKTLEYYQKEGFLNVEPLTRQPEQLSSNESKHLVAHKRLNELIPYNDCFYRNLYKYSYIAAVDLDEVIMPLGNLTHWRDLIEVAHNIAANLSSPHTCPYGHASICFRNIYFPLANQTSSISNKLNFFPILQHVARVSLHSDKNLATKCLHNTSEVVTLHNHFPLYWLKSCRPISMPEEYAQLQHYHVRTPEMKQEEFEKPLVADYSILRYKDALVQNVWRVLKHLNASNDED